MIAIEAIEINLFEKSIRFTDSWLIEINTIRSIHVQYDISLDAESTVEMKPLFLESTEFTDNNIIEGQNLVKKKGRSLMKSEI